MWKTQWPEPPSSYEELRVWKVYCRVFDDVGCAAPGQWIVMWLRSPTYTEDIYDEHYNYHGVEAIRWYIMECKE